MAAIRGEMGGLLPGESADSAEVTKVKKKKTEWSAALILEIVFGAIGTIFTVLGAAFGMDIDEIAASPGSRGNVYLMPWVFGAVGAAFLLVFAILLFLSVRRKKKRRALIENGRYINACVSAVKQDLLVKINNRHPYYVICEGVNPYTGETLTFRSSDIMEDPSRLTGRYVRVFIDFRDPRKYYVEVYRDEDQGSGQRMTPGFLGRDDYET